MSKLSSIRKPPLPKSPVRLRPRRILRSVTNSLQTPPGSLTKSEKLNRNCSGEKSDLRPEYLTISCELRALAKMVGQKFGGEMNEVGNGNNLGANTSPVFERGRFYDEYSARRNARLKRKKGEIEDEGKTTPYGLGVTAESTKRKDSKKLLRKSVCSAYKVERESETPRYMLRSMTKENRKPPLAVGNSAKSVVGGDRKIGTSSRVRRN